MKRYRNLTYLLILMVSVSMFNVSCGSETQSKDKEDADTTETIPVEAASVTKGDISAFYSATATLEAEDEARVISKVQGEVEQIFVEEGDYVSAGDKLAKLEDDQLQIEAEQAKAEMMRLKNEYERKQKLFEKKLISAEEFDNARYAYESQKSSYQLVDLRLRYTTVKAPISGVISERQVKKGNMVNTSESIFVITDFDPLLAIIHVPEHEMSKLDEDQPAKLRVDALPDTTFEGKVERISPVVNPETGTFKVTLTVNDPSGKLKPGMFGRINVIHDVHQNTKMIPKQAVMEEDGISNVFVIKDRMAFRSPIKTGYVDGDYVEVVSGLADTSQVVTVGQNSLQDSALVEVIDF